MKKVLNAFREARNKSPLFHAMVTSMYNHAHKYTETVYNSSVSLRRLICDLTEAPLVVAKVQAPPAMVTLQFLASHLEHRDMLINNVFTCFCYIYC